MAQTAFSMGQVVITARARETLYRDDVAAALARHAVGDWGEIDEHDRRQNEQSLKLGMRLFSVYHAFDGTTFWVITEADRSATTVLLPDDY